MERRLRWSLLVLAAATIVQGRIKQSDITGLVGDSIKLPCEVDEEKCGEMHNIQWYRGDGDTRVFVYSELADVDTSENMLQGRGFLEYTKGSPLTELEIRNLRADDESLYKCELTYVEVRDNCAVIQFVNLSTLAKPESIRILLEDGTEATPGSVIGPFEEDGQLHLKCESDGGKPAASVTWWNNTINMGGDVEAIMSEDGTGVGINKLRVPLTRHDLGSVFECRASNEAVEYPLSAKVTLDLSVRPQTIELAGLEEPVRQGTQVTLTCKVVGARPAANITWLRGGEELKEQTSDSERIQPDSTTETISRYTFTATREVNGDHIVCIATNAVIERKNESPLRAPVKVEVLYAPLVSVEPSNITVNESMDLLLFCQFDANPSNLSSVIWYKDDNEMDLSDEEKFGGGTLENPSLFIKNTSRHDVGRYRCEVANSVGVGTADNVATVHVQFPPDTVLTMEPGIVLEKDRRNVSFHCDIAAGNPDELLSVRWYLDGELLREVPEGNCTNDTDLYGNMTDLPYYIQDDSKNDTNDTNEVLQLTDNCDTDPTRLVMMGVMRGFMANYSCAGKNSAGWGPRSAEKELVVRYPPNQTILVHHPLQVVKGSAVTLTCEVDDPGYPPADQYIWMRGQHLISDVRESQWRISTVKLEDATTFSCTASNAAGNSKEGTVSLEVFTKPQFITRPQPYPEKMRNSSSTSLTCRVECSPLCSLEWLKDDEVIEEDNPFYSIKMSTLDPDLRTNDLESIMSTLTWNMSAWPGQMLDRVKDNANYTCRSTANGIGPGVSSTSVFIVQYPPENISLTPTIVDVEEGQTPDEVTCQASAYPAATYIWKKDDVAVQTGDRLRLEYKDGIKREKAGEYVCQAQNKHGVNSAAVFVNVMYKPECVIRQTEEEGEYLLLCEVDAVPDDVTFTWHFDNETLKEGIRTDGTVSTLTVQPGSRDYGTYSCHVNNTVGAGTPCEIQVAGVSGWGMYLSSVNLIIIIAVVAVALMVLLIICIIVILWCRRKKTKDKYGVPNPLEERENPDGTSASPSSQGVQPLHKWPIRPGVHVHVTNVQSLSKLSDQPAEAAGAPPPTQEKVVTFRRVETDSDSKEDNLDTVGDPSKSKSSPNGAGAPDDRAVYENLPFHGMQQPPSKLGDGSPARVDAGQSRPPSELSQNGSSGYGSTFSQGNPQYGSMRSQRSFQYGSTRSQRGEPDRQTGQQLLPIPQSPDLPETPLTHDKTTQSETNNNECDRPVPPQRGPSAKPPYHNLSLPYRGHRARQRQEQSQAERRLLQAQPAGEQQGDSFEMWEQTPPHPLANRGFYNCNQPPQQRLSQAEPWAPPHQRSNSQLNPAHRPRPHGSRPAVPGQQAALGLHGGPGGPYAGPGGGLGGPHGGPGGPHGGPHGGPGGPHGGHGGPHGGHGGPHGGHGGPHGGPGGPHGGPGGPHGGLGGPHGGISGPHGGPGSSHGGPGGPHGGPGGPGQVPLPAGAGGGGPGPRGPMTYNVKNGTVYADLEYRDVCGAPSRVQKDYVPTEYAVLQFSGASHEIDV